MRSLCRKCAFTTMASSWRAAAQATLFFAKKTFKCRGDEQSLGMKQRRKSLHALTEVGCRSGELARALSHRRARYGVEVQTQITRKLINSVDSILYANKAERNKHLDVDLKLPIYLRYHRRHPLRLSTAPYSTVELRSAERRPVG